MHKNKKIRKKRTKSKIQRKNKKNLRGGRQNTSKAFKKKEQQLVNGMHK
jgi:hypothetical protein